MASILGQCARLGILAVTASVNTGLACLNLYANDAEGQLIDDKRGYRLLTQDQKTILEGRASISPFTQCCSSTSPLFSMIAVQQWIELQGTRFEKVAELLSRLTLLSGMFSSLGTAAHGIAQGLFFEKSYIGRILAVGKIALGLTGCVVNTTIHRYGFSR